MQDDTMLASSGHRMPPRNHFDGRPAIVNPSTHDIAWAAGIYEGEGTCAKGCCIKVIQLDPWLLYKIKDLFGGVIKNRVTPKGKPCYEWMASGSRARGIAWTFYKFLSPRRQRQLIKTCRIGIDNRPTCGFKHTSETKAKMSATKRARNYARRHDVSI